MKMNRLLRIIKTKSFIIGASLLIVYTLSGFFLVPYLVGHYVPKIVHDRIDKKASIGEVRFNPFVFTFEANDFAIDEPDDRPILGFKRLFFNFQLRSIFKWAWTFKEVAVEVPWMNAVIAPDGTLNLADLSPPPEVPPVEDMDELPEEEEPYSLPRLSVGHFIIQEGRVDLVDERPSIPAAVNFEPLSLNMKNLTTLPEEEGSGAITIISGDGATFHWVGDFSLNPLATKGSFAIEDIQKGTLWKFIRDELNLEMPEGSMNLSADYDFHLGHIEPRMMLSNLDGTLTGLILKLEQDQEPFLEVAEAIVRISQIDLIKQYVDVENVLIADGFANLAVDESGMLNLERIIRASDGPNSGSQTPAVYANVSAEPWIINLSAFEVDGFGVDYQDMSRKERMEAGIGDIKVALKAVAEAGIPQTRLFINDLAVGLYDITAGLSATPEPEVRIDEFVLEKGVYDLTANHFTAEKASINGGTVDFRRQADGSIDLLALVEPPMSEAVDDKVEEIPDDESVFRFMINTVAASGLEVAFTDLSVEPEIPILNLENITLVLNDLDGISPSAFDAKVNVRQGGQIMAEGMIDPSVPSVKSDINVENLELKTFQPYVETLAFLVVDSGYFSTHGTMQYGNKQKDSQISYDGGFSIDNLNVVEPESNETFVGWKNFGTESLKLQIDPNRLEIGQLDIVQLSGSFIIYEDQTLNVLEVIKTDPDVEPIAPEVPDTDEKAADLFSVLVRNITLSDGNVEFADLSLKPQFGTRIHELKGSVFGVSTDPDALAEVSLEGLVDEYGTARIHGELNASNPTAFTNMGLVFRNIEMTNLTPYSGRFAGREIDSGRLSVDLNYLIEDSRLIGENQIVVEQLVLGERVESPDALKLPLDLAIALLEDSRGVIDIGLPIRGNLDDPEFSLGPLIWRAFTSLLGRVVTSPFRALAALIPGAEDKTLNIIAFETGRSNVPPPEREKLVLLAEALQERPRLKVTVEGRYNPETDAEVLRTASLRRALASRMDQKVEPDEDPGPVNFRNPEVQEVIEKMFEERFDVDELNAVKEELKRVEENTEEELDTIPEDEIIDRTELARELFGRLEEVETIEETDLLKLAEDRANAIVNELTGPGGIDEDRTEIKPPSSVEKEHLPTALLDLETLQ